MKTNILYLVFLSVCMVVKTSGMVGIDSLVNLYHNSKTDTAKISCMIKIGDVLSDQNPDSAIVWLNMATKEIDNKIDESMFFQKSMLEKLEKQKSSALNIIGYSNLSKGLYEQSFHEFDQARQILVKLNDKKYLPVTLMNMGICYKELGKLDSALVFYEEARTLYLQNMDSSGYMKVAGNIGVVYQRHGKYREALAYYVEVAKYAERHNQHQMHFISLNNIGYLYYLMDNKSKAIDYFLQCLDVLLKSGNQTQLPILYSNISSVYYEIGEKQKASEFYLKSNNGYIAIGDSIGLGHNLFNRASMMAIENGFKQAIPYYLEALAIFERLKSPVNQIEVLYRLGSKEMVVVDPQKANHYALKLIKIAEEYKSLQHLRKAYKIYSELLEAKNDYKNAFTYFKKFTEIKDSILSESKQKDIIEIETRFQTEKKEQEIELQKAQLAVAALKVKKQRAGILALIGIFGSILIALFVSLYFWRKRKQHQLELALKNEELAKQQFQGLFRESQWNAIREKISGQEEERQRIARDLHDGVGGNLAAIKMQMEMAREKPNPEEMTNILHLVSNTWEEVRNISHNLVPPQFEEVSFSEVLNYYVSQLNKSGKIIFTIQFFPVLGWENIAVTIQVEVYRILQELCTNLLKYSNASHARIQVSRVDSDIQLGLEDNGADFEYQQGGIGHRNLLDRVKLLGGSFEKSYRPESGNCFEIQIPLHEKLNV